jgi:hypothetical protein
MYQNPVLATRPDQTMFYQKLDGVGPLITDPPPIRFTTLSKKKKKINKKNKIKKFDM